MANFLNHINVVQNISSALTIIAYLGGMFVTRSGTVHGEPTRLIASEHIVQDILNVISL